MYCLCFHLDWISFELSLVVLWQVLWLCQCILLVLCARFEFVLTFWLDPKRLKSDIHMFAIVAKDCEATLVLTNAEYNYMKKAGEIKAMFTAGTVKWPELEWITIDGMVKKCQVKAPERELMDTCQKDDIAFLQYTSGSTANPKVCAVFNILQAYGSRV